MQMHIDTNIIDTNDKLPVIIPRIIIIICNPIFIIQLNIIYDQYVNLNKKRKKFG